MEDAVLLPEEVDHRLHESQQQGFPEALAPQGKLAYAQEHQQVHDQEG